MDNQDYKAPYFTAIDGLRLLASVNIVLFHLQISGGLHNLGGSPGWLFRIIKGPAFHASAFFILGGFIFTTKFAGNAATFKTLPFFKKRLRELYPLHLLTTLLMAALFIYNRYGNDALSIRTVFFSLFMHLSFLWSFLPFGSLPLNRPSWALSAFFLCYLLFGPMLRKVLTIQSKHNVAFLMLLFFLLLNGWGLLYGVLNTPGNLYFFFHIFGPVRLIEFILGMLLAKLYLLRTNQPHGRLTSVKDDLIFSSVLILIFFNLGLQSNSSPLLRWFSYHVFMIPLYMTALYILALQRGYFSRFFSLPLLRKTGRASFYPYLLHIPLISIIGTVCERGFGYRTFLHSPLNVTLFTVLLYSASYLYVNRIKKKISVPGKNISAQKAKPISIALEN